MRWFMATAVLAALSGCSLVAPVVPAQAWSYDGMDPIRQQAADTDSAARIAQLERERDVLRTHVAVEPEIGAREALYEDLHVLRAQISSLQAGTARTWPWPWR